MGSRAWVLAIALGLVAVHTVSATNYTLGGAAGWTYLANINYTNELADITLKVGDTLIFNNTDTFNHQLLLMPTQAAYDACDYAVATNGIILKPDYYFAYTFKEPLAEVYVICGYHCLWGQKVKFSVANADGTPAPGSSRNATSANPFGFRNDAAGIARFGWFTIAVVCALSCYNIL